MLTYAKVPIATNQVELHPYFVREDVLKFHKKFNITVTAYAPIGSKSFTYRKEEYLQLDPLVDPVIVEIAKKHGKSPSQVILNWHLHRGIIIIPKTAKVERLGENINVYDFKLSEEEYASISALDKGARFYNPLHIPAFGWNNLPYYE